MSSKKHRMDEITVAWWVIVVIALLACYESTYAKNIGQLARQNSIEIALISFVATLIIYSARNRHEFDSIVAEDAAMLKRLQHDSTSIDPRANKLVYKSSNENFTENKTVIFLRLRNANGDFYHYNTLMHINLHELAHAFSTSYDEHHTSNEFHKNHNLLIKRAIEKGLYIPPLKPHTTPIVSTLEKTHKNLQ